MKERLSSSLVLYFFPTFPRLFGRCRGGAFAVVGVGGNIGDVTMVFRKLALMLAANRRVGLVATSPILKNPPFGYPDQPDFFNAILFLCTKLSPRELLHFLLRTERRFGRRRSFPNAPRTLDLDIIFFEDRRVQSDDLIIPHRYWMERESVIIPLRYMGEVR
ncbi:MAG: 2-amino-4-hydroxy-6-hydroxymethyldihydropteridine diphosphokinase [Epsilonproteobacteria bacterium]|nr:2-amino-4-hydroxy-6-hydroxymethyldihydropteridine diphosphokinase [Campylobacterota bacterium]NPA56695.1 2-amino-4-hydroxy-6-hydroxymethyldihydropteridine diphosphokinase [Campylobacterota bacterium]